MEINRDSPTCLIRERDRLVIRRTTRFMSIPSHDVVRRLIQFGFRDGYTFLDLTHAGGNFWREPLPPGIVLTTNNIDPNAATDLHCDFTNTGLPDSAYDVCVIDPPHNPDAGERSFMKARYGTVAGTNRLRELSQAEAREAWRIARVGIIVKVCDQNHGDELIEESQWVREVIPTQPYTLLHQLRQPTADGRRPTKGRRKLHQRVPYTDAATYLVFRHDSPVHRDWDKEYLRQEGRRCLGCGKHLLDKRRQATTCSDGCRQKVHRQR